MTEVQNLRVTFIYDDGTELENIFKVESVGPGKWRDLVIHHTNPHVTSIKVEPIGFVPDRAEKVMPV